MTEEIVFEEKQPANEVMSREELKTAIGSPTLRKACLKSSNPELHLNCFGLNKLSLFVFENATDSGNAFLLDLH